VGFDWSIKGRVGNFGEASNKLALYVDTEMLKSKWWGCEQPRRVRHRLPSCYIGYGMKTLKTFGYGMIWAYHLWKSQDQKCSPSHCIWAKCNNRMSYLCVFAYCPCSCRHLMSSACSRLCRFVHMDC